MAPPLAGKASHACNLFPTNVADVGRYFFREISSQQTWGRYFFAKAQPEANDGDAFVIPIETFARKKSKIIPINN
jgi:hypothetical protein